MRRADLHRRGAMTSPRGFTLVEMLVTLVLAAMVSTLLWQALALAGRLEQSLARAQQDGQEVQLRGAWLRLALEGLTVPPGAPQALRGTERRLESLTTAPPWPGSQGPEPFALELRPDTADGTLGPGDSADRTPLRLWALRPATGENIDLGPRAAGTRFEYLDASGRWQTNWPPADLSLQPAGVQRPLPRAVRITAASPEQATTGDTVIVAPQATRNPMLTRQQTAPPDDTR